MSRPIAITLGDPRGIGSPGTIVNSSTPTTTTTGPTTTAAPTTTVAPAAPWPGSQTVSNASSYAFGGNMSGLVEEGSGSAIPGVLWGVRNGPGAPLELYDLATDAPESKNLAATRPDLVTRAEAFMKSSGIGDTAVFGPELEFFVFDDVRYDVQMQGSFYSISSNESPWNSGIAIEGGNLAHRPGVKGGYFPVQPVDTHNDLRAEMMSVCTDMGLVMEIHHHEVAPAQNELGFKFDTLVKTADNVQKYKYSLHNVAHSYGKSLTFMPKPLYGDNGSGMHTHQSIWKDGKPLFAGSGYADLSETALYYIGGIIKHAKALNAFTNASTNSYKRVIPGFEAPVLLAYSSRNRSASCRIPYASSPKGKRVEVRFPDPSANPYLAFAAMLMAGLDGIKNKIHPGDPMDKNLYDLPPEELSKVPTVAGSLREALNALDADRSFLTQGGVFTDDQIDAYMELKWEEVYNWEHQPAPIEYKMYYSI